MILRHPPVIHASVVPISFFFCVIPPSLALVLPSGGRAEAAAARPLRPLCLRRDAAGHRAEDPDGLGPHYL